MLTLEIRGADIFENTHECRFYKPYVLRGITFFSIDLENFQKNSINYPEKSSIYLLRWRGKM